MPSYFDQKHTGGLHASRGFSFQDVYAALHTLECLCDASFEATHCEADTDITFVFTNRRHYVQAKSSRLSLTLLKQVLVEFTSRSRTDVDPDTRFAIAVGNGLAERVAPLADALDGWHQYLRAAYEPADHERVERDVLALFKQKGCSVESGLARRLSIEQVPRYTTFADAVTFFQGRLAQRLGILPMKAANIFDSWMSALADARSNRAPVPRSEFVAAVAAYVPEMTVEDVDARLSGRVDVAVTFSSTWTADKGMVTGRVSLEGTRQPVAGALVTLYSANPQHSLTATTLPTGSYQFSDVVEGTYRPAVQLQYPSNALAETGRGPAFLGLYVQGDHTYVGAGATVEINIELPNQGHLFGMVTDKASKRPIRGAVVLVATAPSVAHTDSDGVFFCHFVATGIRTVGIVAPGYQPANLQMVVKHLLEVGGAQRLDVELIPVSGTSPILLGSVSEGLHPRAVNGPPVASANGATVTLNKEGKLVDSATISQPGAANGWNYAFKLERPGTYTVTAAKAGYQTATTVVHGDGPVTWAPNLHLRPLEVADPPCVEQVCLKPERVLQGEVLHVRIRTSVLNH